MNDLFNRNGTYVNIQTLPELEITRIKPRWDFVWRESEIQEPVDEENKPDEEKEKDCENE